MSEVLNSVAGQRGAGRKPRTSTGKEKEQRSLSPQWKQHNLSPRIICDSEIEGPKLLLLHGCLLSNRLKISIA